MWDAHTLQIVTTSELPAFTMSRRPSTAPTTAATAAGTGGLTPAPVPASTYRVCLAADSTDVEAAQRLRFTVFDTECGASTPGPVGLDADPFDDVCDHLIVCHDRPGGAGESAEEVVATYRLLPPHANDFQPRAGGLYSSGEFDLSPLEAILDRTVEAGRSCVAAEHRGAAPISLLWGGITGYLATTGYRYLLGCASISLDDGGGNAAAFDDLARARHAADENRWCTPVLPLDTSRITRPARPAIPPLLRGYLRLGAVICGPPCIDPEFGTADFLTLLDVRNADPRYLRFFAGYAPTDLFGRR